jgi:hypothetical protein
VLAGMDRECSQAGCVVRVRGGAQVGAPWTKLTLHPNVQ